MFHGHTPLFAVKNKAGHLRAGRSRCPASEMGTGGISASEMIATANAKRFLSTPSARRATGNANVFLGADKFLSTPSARRATRHRRAHPVHRPISIHALREEGDLQPCKNRHFAGLFLSTPSARRATWAKGYIQCTNGFLSTPSARRATKLSHERHGSRHYFYPRPPRGGRHARGIAVQRLIEISIHALREEGDRHND